VKHKNTQAIWKSIIIQQDLHILQLFAFKLRIIRQKPSLTTFYETRKNKGLVPIMR